jgi:hypothetical protein
MLEAVVQAVLLLYGKENSGKEIYTYVALLVLPSVHARHGTVAISPSHALAFISSDRATTHILHIIDTSRR